MVSKLNYASKAVEKKKWAALISKMSIITVGIEMF